MMQRHIMRLFVFGILITAGTALAKEPEQPLKEGEKIKVLLDVPEGAGPVEQWPVMIGVPFPAGTLLSADQVRLVDNNGKEIPCQKEVTGRWALEGAIQWLRFDALVSSKNGCQVEVVKADGGAKAEKPVVLTEKDGRVELDTGERQALVPYAFNGPVIDIDESDVNVPFHRILMYRKAVVL